MDPIAEGLLKAARPELGYREKGGQHTKFGTWYANLVQDPQYRDAPWCDMFIAWAAQKAGVQDFVGQFAWTPSHAAWFIQRGAWSQTPEPGALVFYDWKGGKSYKGIDHVGIVEKVAGSKIHTIEANVDRVWLKRKVRDTDKVVGYGLPRMVKERPTLIEVRPSDKPLQPFTVQADAPVARAGDSPFDLLGTPQALLAAMVLTTVIVSFRMAGRSRGSGRHRRGLFPWITSTATSGAGARPTGSPTPARATPPARGPASSATSPGTAPQVRATSTARGPASGAASSPSPEARRSGSESAARGSATRTGGPPTLRPSDSRTRVPESATPRPRMPADTATPRSRVSDSSTPRPRVPAGDAAPRARAQAQAERARGPLERSGERAQAGRTSGNPHPAAPQTSPGTGRRRKPYEATTGK
ncbi:CHAP domain-containing protein [Nonomuraea sp. bgisy101]|uniref:CHAP domain-containing protein n=1 Tax=Nonomuraea sp. bgisy101 TaxID=3413784 RepID=UPI003D70CECA